MCPNFSELLFLRWNKNAVFKKNNQNKPLEKCLFCYFMFGSWPYFLNKTLHKVYDNQLRKRTEKNAYHSSSLHNI